MHSLSINAVWLLWREQNTQEKGLISSKSPAGLLFAKAGTLRSAASYLALIITHVLADTAAVPASRSTDRMPEVGIFAVCARSRLSIGAPANTDCSCSCHLIPFRPGGVGERRRCIFNQLIHYNSADLSTLVPRRRARASDGPSLVFFLARNTLGDLWCLLWGFGGGGGGAG